MKQLGVGVLMIIWTLLTSCSASAIETQPSANQMVKTSGPFLITGYSFAGHSLRYVQVYNSSSQLAALDGWRVITSYSATQQVLIELQGRVAPGKYITIANKDIVPSATFTFTDWDPASDPTLTSISLAPPAYSNFNQEVVSPTITGSTLRSPGMPSIFYFGRNVSSSTGNYLSTFTAFLPSDNFTLMTDPLYVPINEPGLMIVEVYPDSITCSPFSTEASCDDYVKLYNPTSNPVDLSALRLRTGSFGQSSSASNTVPLQGILFPGHYASFVISLNDNGSWIWLEDTYGMEPYGESLISYPSTTGNENQAWARDLQTDEWQWTIFPRPDDEPSQFAIPEVANMCEGLKISEIAANVAAEDQFIELYNSNSIPISIDQCALQTNRSTTKTFVLNNAVLEPGEFVTVYIKDTNLTLTKTTSGVVYILSSDLSTEVESVAYDNLRENSSLSRIDGAWLQTYQVTPNAPNVWLQNQPCNEGYERSTSSGMCVKTQVGSALAACSSGKYRNPETNRCRNIVSTESLFTSCLVNQERNPITNRCRSIAASSIKPCPTNQERNPATNRCRNKTKSSVADFPIDTMADSTQALLGGWAFAGVGLLAVGYAGWEWRYEVLAFARRAYSFVVRRF